MSLEALGARVVAGVLSGEVALLAGDVEVEDLGRQSVEFAPDAERELCFAPATRDWTVTDIAVYWQGRRLLTHPLAEPVAVAAGRELVLELTLGAELAPQG